MRRRIHAGWLPAGAFLVVLMLVICVSFAATAAAAPGPSAAGKAAEILPLDKVVPGMKGVALTVFRGKTVEDFPVEILGRLRNQVAGGDLLLIRVGGRALEEAGGIASGMSGSPVYVDGKLVGAISYGMGFADHSLGMVTPIEQMLAVLDTARQKAASGVSEKAAAELAPGWPRAALTPVAPAASRWDVMPPVTLNGKTVRQLTAEPVSTPVLVSGLGPRATDWLNRSWRLPGFTAVRAGGGAGFAPAADLAAPGTAATPPTATATAGDADALRPGSAIGVGLMRGDVEMAVLGTLTYRDGNDFLALGHPVLSKGAVDLIATDAYIFTTVKSVDTPFKIGAPVGTVGRVTEDRSWGVAGSIGAPPATIPLSVTVTDRDRGPGRVTAIKATSVSDPDLAGTLLAAAALEGFDRGIDRIGKGTAHVTFTFESPELPGGRLARENTFYSQGDVSAAALGELLDGLDLVLNNEFSAVNLSSVSVSAEVGVERKTATIEKAVLKNPDAPVHPGDKVALLVTLRPWRGQPVTKEVFITLPETTEPGKTQVTVRAGGIEAYGTDEVAPSTPEKAKPKPGQPPQPPVPGEQAPTTSGGSKAAGVYASLEDLVRDFVEREHNTDLVAEYYPTPGEGANDGSNAAPTEMAPIEGAPTGGVPPDAAPPDGQDQPPDVAPPGNDGASAAEQNPIPPEVAGREKKPTAAPGQPAEEGKPVRSVLPTDFVLDGMVSVDVEVANP